jgi:hypothetical protein
MSEVRDSRWIEWLVLVGTVVVVFVVAAFSLRSGSMGSPRTLRPRSATHRGPRTT